MIEHFLCLYNVLCVYGYYGASLSYTLMNFGNTCLVKERFLGAFLFQSETVEVIY